jgi:hypothetical protein
VQRPVHRRRVFYIPGYDPIHPRRYREMYRREGAEQALISDYEISLTPKTTKGPYGWHVLGDMDGMQTTADFEVLVWSDIVRDSMSNSISATYAQLLRTAWIYIGTGTLFRLMKLRKGPVIAALYPVAMLVLQLLVAVVVGWGVTQGIGLFSGVLDGALNTVIQLGSLLFGLVAVVVVLRWFRARDNRLMAYYLMHDYAYSAHLHGAIPADLNTRLAEFGDRIAAELQQDVDEVLIVGHSSGAHLAVTVLADLIRAGRVPNDGPALGFLSLGQVVPMVSFLPDADQLRGDLQYLSARDELAWVDVSAPGDGCAFALCDPVTVSGVAPKDKKWPLVFSAAFSQTLSSERWKKLKRRYFRLHFQYLCAFDRPKDYDYFRITAGPKTLAARYDGRPPSKSRINVAVSKYTSVRTL